VTKYYTEQGRRWLRSRSGVVLLGFLAIIVFFLVTEHMAHVFGILPYLLLLACPLMHVRARRLSQATMRNIRQNLFFAFVYNALGVPIAAGLLYPWTGLLLSPIIASAAMTFSSVSVIANALRLRTVRL
jgi:hypothetical protein